MSSYSTVNTLKLSANNMDISNNLNTETMQAHIISCKITENSLGILTSGTNKTINVGNSTSNVHINGNVTLSVGTFHMSGFFNQLS